jgi:hypothetical protein
LEEEEEKEKGKGGVEWIKVRGKGCGWNGESAIETILQTSNMREESAGEVGESGRVWFLIDKIMEFFGKIII